MQCREAASATCSRVSERRVSDGHSTFEVVERHWLLKYLSTCPSNQILSPGSSISISYVSALSISLPFSRLSEWKFRSKPFGSYSTPVLAWWHPSSTRGETERCREQARASHRSGRIFPVRTRPQRESGNCLATTDGVVLGGGGATCLDLLSLHVAFDDIHHLVLSESEIPTL